MFKFSEYYLPQNYTKNYSQIKPLHRIPKTILHLQPQINYITKN